MQLQGCHLTYCSNIHAGETWREIAERLRRNLPVIKAEICPDEPFGVGLRLSAIAAKSLADPARLEAFKNFLEDGGFYVFTINGFPYGPFHGRPVKEAVYQPDWSFDSRLTYSNQLADLMAALLPAGVTGSISTVPGTFKPLAEPKKIERIADNLIRHAAHLAWIARERGRIINLALEPEPCCLLETIEESVAFFKNHLFSAAAAERMAMLSGLGLPAAEEALRRHLGICYDVCHAAVEFEDPAGSIKALQSAGIGINKLQLSAALRIPNVDRGTPEQLRGFDEPVYLHQVVERRPDGLSRYLDLPDALAKIDTAVGREWRIHFHVPIFLSSLEHFASTQDFLVDILTLHRAAPLSPHLEVETYTWDVLPEIYRTTSVCGAIARELAWARDRIATPLR